MCRCFPLWLVWLRASGPSRFHFPASPGSRRFPALRRYYGRSDFRRSALRPLPRHEHRTCPGRKFSAYRNNGSCHSVSNHGMCASGIFFCHRFSSSPNAGFGLGRLVSPDRLFSERGLLGSRLRVSMARSPVASHRIEFTAGSSRNPCITDWHFISSCSPRSGFPRRSFFPLQAG